MTRVALHLLALGLSLTQSNSAQTAARRRLAPLQNCTVKVYNRRTDSPSEFPDTSGTCPIGGGSRAFLLDPNADKPVLNGEFILS